MLGTTRQIKQYIKVAQQTVLARKNSDKTAFASDLYDSVRKDFASDKSKQPFDPYLIRSHIPTGNADSSYLEQYLTGLTTKPLPPKLAALAILQHGAFEPLIGLSPGATTMSWAAEPAAGLLNQFLQQKIPDPQTNPWLGISQVLHLTKAERLQLRRDGKRICDELTAILPRQSIEVQSQQSMLQQQFGFVPVTGATLEPTHLSGKTSSSEAARFEQQQGKQYLQNYCANLAAITDETGRLRLVRSSRSDTPGKLRELFTFAAMHNQVAFAGQEKPQLQVALITAMDRSLLKDTLLRIAYQERERPYLLRMRRAITRLFGKISGQRTIKLPQTNGTEQEVIINKPWVIETVLSGAARKATSIRQARRKNHPTARRAFAQLAQILQQQPHATVLGEKMAEAAQLGPKQIRRWLSQLTAAELSGLTNQERSSLEVLRLTLVGRTTAGDRMLHKTDPIRELWCWQAVLSVCNILPAVQCKSGQDRTLTMVSALCAAAEQQEQQWQPWQAIPREQLTRVQAAFSKFANQFGPTSIKALRGPQGKVKWKYRAPGKAYHPVPGWLYTDIDTNLVGPLKSINNAKQPEKFTS